MKNYSIIAALLISFFSLHAAVDKDLLMGVHKDRLQDAIEVSNAAEIRKLLRRIGALEQKEKKSFVEAAEEVVDEREAHVSLFKSTSDLVKFLLGSAWGAGALYWGFRNSSFGLASSAQDEDDTFIDWKRLLMYGTLSIPGFYFAFKGFRCSRARERLAEAHKALAEIEKAEVKGKEQTGQIPPNAEQTKVASENVVPAKA